MEDAHVMLDNFNSELRIKDDTPRSFYAIYDGHGGDSAAKHCGVFSSFTFLPYFPLWCTLIPMKHFYVLFD